MTPHKSGRNRFAIIPLYLFLACCLAPAPSARANDKAPPEPRFITYTVKNPSKAVKAVGYNVFLKGVFSDQIDKDKTAGKVFKELRMARDEGKLGVTLFFETPDGQVLPGDGTDTIKIQFKVGKSPKTVQFGEISNMRSTRGLSGTVIGELDEPPGGKLEGDPVFTAINSDDQGSILVRDLQFWIDAPSVEDSSLLLDYAQSFGFGPSEPDIFLSANGGFQDVQVFGSIDVGNWLYARGRMFDGGEEVSGFVYGFDTAPEPSGLAVCACAGLTLVMMLRSRRLPNSKRTTRPASSRIEAGRVAANMRYSDHTASSFPLGSRKWKRRPPGKLKVSVLIVPPAALTLE